MTRAAQSNSKQYEVLVVGAGPAGLTAALRAAKLGLSVQIIDKAKPARQRSSPAWIGPAGVALCEAMGLKSGPFATAFRGLRLFSSDFKKTAEVGEAALRGWIVDRAAFDAALLKLAEKAGAKLVAGAPPSAVRLGESAVAIELARGESASGQIAVIADGVESQTAKLAGVAPPAMQLSRCAVAEWDITGGKPALDVVVLSGRAALIACVVRSASRVRVSLLGRDPQADVESALNALVQAGQSTCVLPKAQPALRIVYPSPAGVALDVESHVGKRCLLCGDAGGFVAAFSNEGIYPAMKSGVIAADVVQRALQSRVPQDELATFGAAWRTELAEYLRMPNTDLALLVPLVFSNAQMSKRVAQAFLLGQSF
ncbi:MAG: NAD(P)/FAD-dependent oxidoreductase [Phycisphaerae bacterium]